MKPTLKELREIKAQYIQQALDEQVPQKSVQIASLGEIYTSHSHGDYQIFPLMYGSHYAVFTHKHNKGRFIKHGKWEQVDRIQVRIMQKFDPYKLDNRSNLPIFQNGLLVLQWEISDSRTDPLGSDLFIPGKWWDKAQEYLPQVKSEAEKSAKAKQELERNQLYDTLLIGKQV